MRLLIVGASGFIGYHLVKKLEEFEQNFEKIVCSYFSNDYFSNLFMYNDSFSSIKCDVSDIESVKLTLNESKPDVILFMASTRYFPKPRNSRDHENVNVFGLENFINYTKNPQSKTKLIFVNSGAAKSIENLSEFDESNIDHYSLSKIRASDLYQREKKNGNILGEEVRLFTPYGPRDYEYRLIQSTTIKLLKNIEPVLNNPDSQRDFIHVQDVVDALIKIIFLQKECEKIIEIGSSLSTKTRDILKKIYEIMDVSKEVKIHSKSNDEEIVYMRANIEIAEKNLDWTPKINIDDGVSETVNWIKENYKRYYE